MKNRSLLDIAVRACFSLLIFFLITIFARFFTRQIFVKKLGWDNAFTKMVFVGAEYIGNVPKTGEDEGVFQSVNWASRYPFEDDGKTVKSASEFPILDKYVRAVDKIEYNIRKYTENWLLCYTQFTKVRWQYNSLVGCEGMNHDSIIMMNNGYMTHSVRAIQEGNLETLADNASEFSNYLNEQGIYFVYANSGSKVCPSDRQLPSGVTENTNENADRLIRLLRDRDVDVLDYRPLQEAAFYDWYDSYYITDHHWKTSTALWAAGVLAEHLNAHAGFAFDLNDFDADMYSVEMKKDYLLGGQGKTWALTTGDVLLEPFEKILPKFQTDYSIQIPSRGVERRGDYAETLFDEDFFETIADYSVDDFRTNRDAYHSAMWRNDALGIVKNHLSETNDGKRILMLQDSFGWYLSTYLAAGVPEIDFLNPSQFNGSLKTYIEETKPDAVVLLMCERNISAIKPEDYDAHTHFFDFR